MTKDELKEILILDTLIDSKLRQLDQLKSYRGRLPGYKAQESVQSSGTSDPTAGLAIKIIRMDEAIASDIERLIDLKAEARELFKTLNHDLKLKAVLELRYLECMDWDEVADEIGYSKKHVTRLHGEALAKLFPTCG